MSELCRELPPLLDNIAGSRTCSPVLVSVLKELGWLAMLVMVIQ
jgi:hypothetical protein